MKIQLKLCSKSSAQRETFRTYMWSLKKKKMQMNLLTKQKHIHRLGERIYGYLKGKGGGRDSQGVWDGHVHIAIFKMDNQ